VNDNHVYLNAAAGKNWFSVELFQENGSIAQDNSVLVYGMYTLLDEQPDIYAYTRVRR
jgi:hypothetical protein